MIDSARLLADTKRQVVALVDDLRTVAAADPAAEAHVAGEYQRARAAGRTALGQAEWAEGLYAQVAVAWVLGCVFVRFCEDNELIKDPLLGGPGIRTQIALDHRAAYLQANPAHDDRHWLREVFGRLGALRATGEILGAHNPVWADGLLPSADAARKLREALTGVDPDTGRLRHDFTDATWDTHFLGDLYQDLSEHAKKTYALLQTPRFVAAFILDRTLEPAIATFGLAATTIIDPTCGSGHFLLGAFERMYQRWCIAEPATNRRELAKRALSAIGGIDLNPFAASIARFRLLVAALGAGCDTCLADAPAYEIHIAVGDSLLHGDPPRRLPRPHASDDEDARVTAHGYETEDVEAVRELLSRGWHAVVGNPPYITVKDPAINAAYRARFDTCHRQYSLGVPFTERFWQLARHESGQPDRAGYVGMITANSFMKREFGKKLIEQWVPANDLTHVIDTSGAYIPGHGTPTVILLGRNRTPVGSTVRAVMSIRGEPSRPTDPEKGLVWSSIVALVDEPGSQSDYVSVVDLDRTRLKTHPWSIGGGGAAELKQRLDQIQRRLGSAIELPIGRSVRAGADEAFVRPVGHVRRHALGDGEFPELLVGEEVRDWASQPSELIWYPYRANSSGLFLRELWRLREMLAQRSTFQGKMADAGLEWWEYMQHTPSAYCTPLSIAFAFVATHNHFVLDRGGKVFNRSAPVIKMPAGADEARHLELLGVLNSSTACFWMKQVFHGKGNGGVNEGYRGQGWEEFWEHDGTKLKQFPLPLSLPGASGSLLDRLAALLAASSPAAIAVAAVPTALALDEAQVRSEGLRGQMVAGQERLDWECYRLYGLVDDDLATGDEPEPPLALGERAFEIVLARRVEAGEEETSWFTRHRSTPITALPAHWPTSYRQLVERRIALIQTDLNIGLIERPECKRRWATKPWAEQAEVALRSWLLDRLETPRYWPAPAAITTVARLTAEARADDDFVSVARLRAGRDDIDLAAVITELIKAESVPYLAALRYSDSGMRKHAEWLVTWALQRREDAGEDVGVIAVPPKYAKPDFTGVGWNHRGKLDVPKERWISYPGAERQADASLVVGWAGWDHLERARALAGWYLQARKDGRDATHLMPLLAGLSELVPWLKQWHDEPDADPSLDRPGSQIAALVDAGLRSLSHTSLYLTSWRPAARPTRRPPRAA